MGWRRPLHQCCQAPAAERCAPQCCPAELEADGETYAMGAWSCGCAVYKHLQQRVDDALLQCKRQRCERLVRATIRSAGSALVRAVRGACDRNRFWDSDKVIEGRENRAARAERLHHPADQARAEEDPFRPALVVRGAESCLSDLYLRRCCRRA